MLKEYKSEYWTFTPRDRQKSKKEEKRFAEIHCIINPASAARRTRGRWLRLLKVLQNTWPDELTFTITDFAGHATLIARQAVEQGSKKIVVMGGDGTIQETVNGLLANHQTCLEEISLGILSSGTGQGLAQSLGLPRDLPAQWTVICQGKKRRIDLARAIFLDEEKQWQRRLFVNECQIGLGADVVQNLSFKTKKLGGCVGFGFTALRTALRQPSFKIRLRLNDAYSVTAQVLGVVIANGAFTGGGMQLAPKALLDDGQLDVLLIHDQSALQRLRNFPSIYTGKHGMKGAFSFYRVRRVALLSSHKAPIAADGEILGSLPLTVEALPSALTVTVP
ncbi:diacylglycerol/lipid kinase family protein [Caldithrix abyssi]